MPIFIIMLTLMLIPVKAMPLPERFTGLLDYVQAAPDQGDTLSCLFVGSTGAMELIANKKAGIRNPLPYGPYDLSESFLINAPAQTSKDKNFLEAPVLRFNIGYGISVKDWPFDAWDASTPNQRVWRNRNWSGMTKIPLPKVKTVQLFNSGNRWATGVLDETHLQIIKEALWKYKSPVLISYNDNSYWHVIMIVGYDDSLPGDCYQIGQTQCDKTTGSFYVRDSFGTPVEVRDYDWFRVRGNAAVIVTEAR